MTQILTIVLEVTAVVIFYWLSFRYIFNKLWSSRLKLALAGFLLWAPSFSILFTGSDGPGSEIVLLFPFLSAIGGYVIGLIFDLIS